MIHNEIKEIIESQGMKELQLEPQAEHLNKKDLSMGVDKAWVTKFGRLYEISQSMTGGYEALCDRNNEARYRRDVSLEQLLETIRVKG